MKKNLSNHKAVILAGGKGTRLLPLTKDNPKPLLKVKEKPIINYLVELFESQGIKEIAVLINKDSREKFDLWQKRYFPDIKLIEEEEPMGTFGGLHYLKDWIGDSLFFLTNGDELKQIDLREMDKFHQEKNLPATIALVKVADSQSYGVVLCSQGMATSFLEKPSPAQISKKFMAGKNPASKYINSGLYLFSPSIFAYHPGPKFLMVEKDIFPRLVKDKKLAAYEFNGKWTDCGTPERYSNAQKEWE